MTEDYYKAKDDEGKKRYDLIPEVCVRELLRVDSKYVWASLELYGTGDGAFKFHEVIELIMQALEYGLKKYGKESSWKNVPHAQDRYWAASHRHEKKRLKGETHASDSGLLHIAHEMCNYMFLLWFEIQEDRDKVTFGGHECHK